MADLNQRQVDELLRKTDENNRMLHKLISGARWARFWSFVYYAIIVGSAIGAYYYIQPYISAVQKAVANPGQTSQQFSEDIFSQFKAQAEKYFQTQSH